MDTYITIKVYDKKAEPFLEGAKEIYEKYHRIANMYEEYDENLFYMNEILKPKVAFEMEASFQELLEFALSWYEKTEGVFNPCIGNVSKIWKQYLNGEKEGIPSKKDLMKAGSVTCDDISLKGNVFQKERLVRLDFGAIAKGYATQKVAQYLEVNGVKKYLINAGGNVKVGDSYKKEPFQIGIQSPTEKNSLLDTVFVTNMAVVTSGDYERFYTYEGKTYSHILDSKTLYPAEYVKSVTVLTEDSAIADVLSTYLFLLPFEEGFAYVEAMDGVEAIWVLMDHRVVSSTGMKQYE